MTTQGQRITTRLDADGTLTVQLEEAGFAAPSGNQVLVKVEAAPINPSDLALLFALADTDNAQYTPSRIVAQMPAAATKAMAGRHGEALPVGNEAAGTVIAAGDSPMAQALMGKRVACVPGSAFATHAICDATMAMPLADGVSAVEGASSFVNPMTALGFTETMKREGYTGLVHAAAASNLGQMLLRICQTDGIPLVNVVRSAEQVALLKGMGASHVINSSDDDFVLQLAAAIAETGAYMGFDPIGGGTMASNMLTAMEMAASKGQAYSRYGSTSPKQVYIYGALDFGPTILNRSFGLTWDLGGWLLTPFLQKAGLETVMAMRDRVMREIKTTFASHYKAQVSLEGMLEKAAVSDYNARRTGEKYLVVPSS